MYQEFVLSFFQEAGDIFKKYFYADKQVVYKEDLSPLTIADSEINSLFIKKVVDAFPTHGVLGEEESLQEQTEYLRVIDPIDGTVPYSHGIPFCTIVVSLLHYGNPIFGAIYEPLAENLYIGDGKITTFNGKQVFVTKETDVTKSIVTLECFPTAKYDLKQLHGALCDAGCKVMQSRAVAYPASRIASGSVMASMLPAGQPREFAAIKPIVEGAGGKVTDLFGQEQLYNTRECRGHLATNGVSHEYFVEMIQKYVDVDSQYM